MMALRWVSPAALAPAQAGHRCTDEDRTRFVRVRRAGRIFPASAPLMQDTSGDQERSPFRDAEAVAFGMSGRVEHHARSTGATQGPATGSFDARHPTVRPSDGHSVEARPRRAGAPLAITDSDESMDPSPKIDRATSSGEANTQPMAWSRDSNPPRWRESARRGKNTYADRLYGYVHAEPEGFTEQPIVLMGADAVGSVAGRCTDVGVDE